MIRDERRLRWKYSGDLVDGGPRLIAPAMLVAAGLGLLVWVLVRRVAGCAPRGAHAGRLDLARKKISSHAIPDAGQQN